MQSALPLLALSMGLLSSLHCIGMCGPIALALPVYKGGLFQQLTGLLVYNGGRALTYSLLGVFFGLVGSSLVVLGLMRYLTIAVGVIILLYVVLPTKVGSRLHPPLKWNRAVAAVKSRLAKYLRSNHAGGWFLLGVFNGLLPCGLVYLALITSVATGTVVNGGLFMLLFGLGTFPAMFAVGFFRHYFTPVSRTKFRRILPIMLGVVGIWLIVRGVLIEFPSSPDSIPLCHGKEATH
jgi:sulfite exporter TauE/SafE